MYGYENVMDDKFLMEEIEESGDRSFYKYLDELNERNWQEKMMEEEEDRTQEGHWWIKAENRGKGIEK